MPGKKAPDTGGPIPKSEKLAGTSAVVVESPRARVSVEIERMARGPAKVSVRIDGEDSEKVQEEAFQIYEGLVNLVDGLTPEEE